MSVQVEVLGYGTRVEVGDTNDFNTTTVWTAVFAELIDVQPPADQVGEISSKHMQSPGMVEQTVPGWIKPGDGEVKAHYNAAEFNTINGYGQSQKAWRIVYNDLTSSHYSGEMFNGYIKEAAKKVDMNGLVTTEIKIKKNGLGSWVNNIVTP